MHMQIAILKKVGRVGPARSWMLLLLLFAKSAASADLHAPTLSYFQHGGAGVQWKFWQAEQNRSTLFLETPSQPGNVFWDFQENSVYFSRDGGIFRASINHVPAQPKRVAPLPAEDGELRALWRERGNGRLRVAYMREVAEIDVLSKGHLRYRLADGSSIPGMAEPSWGLPYICTVLELGDDGAKWKMLARRATKDMAGDTPGIAVIDDLRHERGVSNERLLESYTCAAGQCSDDVPANLVKLIGDQAGLKFKRGEAGILRHKTLNSAVVFATVVGDQLHMAPPVALVPAYGRVSGVSGLEGEEHKQLGMTINTHYLLLEGDLDGRHPVVIDLRNGSTVLQTPGWAATWLIKSGYGSIDRKGKEAAQ